MAEYQYVEDIGDALEALVKLEREVLGTETRRFGKRQGWGANSFSNGRVNFHPWLWT